jgi:hypothetical protein
MKKKTRSVHIEGEEWLYVVDTYKMYDSAQVRIYSPDKKMVRVDPYDMCIASGHKNIQPSTVKNYILENLING